MTIQSDEPITARFAAARSAGSAPSGLPEPPPALERRAAAPAVPSPNAANGDMQVNHLYARQVHLDGGPDAGVLFAHSKTRAYTIGMNADTSMIAVTNDQRFYTTIIDGAKGNLWVANRVHTNNVLANIVDLAGPNNHVKFLQSKSNYYTIGINGDDSAMAFAHPESGQYTIFIDGRQGDIVLHNADCAEDFDVPDGGVEPGTVMVLDDDGAVTPSTQAYDTRVAGVVSGAGSHRPGVVLDRRDTGRTRQPIALMGKVFCRVDAREHPIRVGDLLTTAQHEGHAMRITEPKRGLGAVLGKAMQPLEGALGLIPVLVALQ
jgi:hypothetical protein